jgi:hypothetical protein
MFIITLLEILTESNWKGHLRVIESSKVVPICTKKTFASPQLIYPTSLLRYLVYHACRDARRHPHGAV